MEVKPVIVKAKKKHNMCCAVPDCDSRSSINVDTSFHSFPRRGKHKVNVKNYFGNVEKVDMHCHWKKVTNVRNPLPSHRICSRHFKADDYFLPGIPCQRRKLKWNAIPSLHLPVINKDKLDKNEKRHDRLNMRQARTAEDNKKTNENDVPKQAEKALEIPDSLQLITEVREDFKMEQRVDEDKATTDVSQWTMMEHIVVKTECENWTQDIGVQVKSEDLAPRFLDFLKTDAQLRTMTGIDTFEILACIEKLARVVYKGKSDSTVTMTLKDKIVMTFVMLKQNLSYPCLSVMFNCYSSEQCATIFKETIVLLSSCMKVAIPWPSKEDISKNLPLCFSKFKNVRVVLDCIEIFIQNPSYLSCKLETYSHYKSSNTVKFMTGVTPAGNISYVSKSYGGHASDKSIFEQSDIVNLLEPGDGIMVGSDFLIDEICALNKWKCIRPPFLKDKVQVDMSESDANLTADIAKARAHIERSNQRIKKFKILGDTLLCNFVPFVEEIFTVICATINLNAPLVSDDKFIKM